MADHEIFQADAAHATHDPELVARVAAGDGIGAEIDRVRTLLATCPSCAGLTADLRAIAAIARADTALDATGRAPRDFRLSVADADRLRRRGVRGTRRPRFATGLVALGLVGVLASAGGLDLPWAGVGASGGSIFESATGASKDLATPLPALGPGTNDTHVLVVTDAPTRTGPIEPPSRGTSPGPLGIVLLVGSIGAVVAGIGLLLAGRLGRSGRRAGP